MERLVQSLIARPTAAPGAALASTFTPAPATGGSKAADFARLVTGPGALMRAEAGGVNDPEKTDSEPSGIERATDTAQPLPANGSSQEKSTPQALPATEKATGESTPDAPPRATAPTEALAEPLDGVAVATAASPAAPLAPSVAIGPLAQVQNAEGAQTSPALSVSGSFAAVSTKGANAAMENADAAGIRPVERVGQSAPTAAAAPVEPRVDPIAPAPQQTQKHGAKHEPEHGAEHGAQSPKTTHDAPLSYPPVSAFVAPAAIAAANGTGPFSAGKGIAVTAPGTATSQTVLNAEPIAAGSGSVAQITGNPAAHSDAKAAVVWNQPPASTAQAALNTIAPGVVAPSPLAMMAPIAPLSNQSAPSKIEPRNTAPAAYTYRALSVSEGTIGAAPFADRATETTRLQRDKPVTTRDGAVENTAHLVGHPLRSTPPGQGAQGLMPVASMAGDATGGLAALSELSGSEHRLIPTGAAQTQTTPALSSNAPPPPVSMTPPAVSQVSALLPRLTPNTPGFELTLNPAELGKVKMRLLLHEGISSVVILAERPETLDLMRRHGADLQQDLARLGYAGAELRFDLSGQDTAQDHRAHISEPLIDRAGADAGVALPSFPPSAQTVLGRMDIRL